MDAKLEIPSFTLPIEVADGLRMDAAEARSLGEFFHEEYQNAPPFPHIVVDDFLPAELARKVLANCPSGERASDGVFNIGYGGENKRQITPEDCNRFSREVFQFFNS